MLPSVRLLVLSAGLVLLGACVRLQTAAPAAPVAAGTVTPSELRVYRTVAESVYVQATDFAVAIASTVMDSTCSNNRCEPISGHGNGTGHRLLVGSNPTPVAEDVVMRDAREIRLDRVALGHPRLVVIDAADIPLATADTSTWRYFRGNYGGIAGVLRFSPVAFDATGQRARVSVQWRCGPACGHVLTVTLRSGVEQEWEITDLLLLQPPPRAGTGQGFER